MLILPLSLTVVTGAFPPERRAAAIGALEGILPSQNPDALSVAPGTHLGRRPARLRLLHPRAIDVDAHSIDVVTLRGHKISRITAFIEPSLLSTSTTAARSPGGYRPAAAGLDLAGPRRHTE